MLSALAVALSAHASHFTDTTVNYSGDLVVGGPTLGTIAGASNVAQWWKFNVVSGTPVTITATRTSGTLTPNTRAYRGTVAENASPSSMPILATSAANGSLATITITFTPTFTGAATLQVSRFTSDTGNYTITATGIFSSNLPPIANAGPDQAVFDHNLANTPTVVGLNGTGSSDPEGQTLSYAWAQIGGSPTVALSGASTATPSFTAPSLANHPSGPPPNIVLTFRLTVSDGTSTRQDDVVITVKHENLAPSAAASAPASAPEGTPVTLNGSASTDGDGDPLAYVWTQTGGTPVTISPNNSNSPTSSFTASVEAPHSTAGEMLTFELTVSDGIATRTSAPVHVFIQNVNRAPTAESGSPQTVCDDISVMLTGDGEDPDDDPITSYRWEQIAGPAVTLQNPDTSTPTFAAPAVAPAAGSVTLTFRLTVSDAIDENDVAGLTGSDTVDILVKHANRAPIADAGQNKTVPELTGVGLDGTGSFDPDTDPIVTYQWTQTGGPAVALSGATTATPSFTAPDVGPAGVALSFELVVTDDPDDAFCGASLASAPSSVSIFVKYVNRAPAANAGAAQNANEGAIVALDGTLSSDPDGNAFAFAWTQISGPAATLSDSAAPSPTFTAPEVTRFGGTIVFQLQVTDEFGMASNVATTSVSVLNINHAPIADAGETQSVPEDTDVALSGTATDQDTEEEPLLTYAWQQTAGPAVTLTGSGASVGFHAPVVTAGGDPTAKVVLKFAVTATDPNGAASAPDEVEVIVANVDHSPIANAGGITVANEASLVTLDGSLSSDPDGDTLTFAWVQTAGPTVALANANSATPSFTTPFVSAAGATLSFKLTVNDGFGGTSCDTATVSVININDPPTITGAAASPGSLWPPNHSMVAISINGVVDPNNNATIRIASVTQDEPTNGLGDGDTSIDAIISADGASVLVRSERSGKGNGRVYHVHFTASDLEGSVSGMVKVSVPHSKKGDAAIDGGELFDSTR